MLYMWVKLWKYGNNEEGYEFYESSGIAEALDVV